MAEPPASGNGRRPDAVLPGGRAVLQASNLTPPSTQSPRYEYLPMMTVTGLQHLDIRWTPPTADGADTGIMRRV
jgi:hypothetical protein